MRQGKYNLTAPPEIILDHLKRLKNFNELYRHKHFQGWLKNVFSWGLLGFDNSDAYHLVEDRIGTLVFIRASNLVGLIKKLVKMELSTTRGVIVGVKIPSKYGLEEVTHIQAVFAHLLGEEATILLQAMKNEKKIIEMYIMAIK